MKVKSVLKLGATARYSIITLKDGKRFEYDIDYTRPSGTRNTYSSWEELDCDLLLPVSVEDSAVDMISVNTATGALVIYTKGAVK